MLKKYGWIFGVRIAIGGAVFTAMGFVAKAMFSSMNRMANDGFNSTGNFSFIYDLSGNKIDASSLGIDISQLGVTSSPFGNVGLSPSLPEPFSILCNFIIGVGLVMLIGGALLAWYLKKKGQERLIAPSTPSLPRD